METCKEIIVSQLRALKPSFLTKKPHFNFITSHYMYIVGLSIIGSVLIYGPGKGTGKGEVKYIDALTFAAGGATQAGLNTVDVNKLTTYQQVVIFVIAGIANPITINSFVVLLRLYWFEKRFQNIVSEARLRRGTISRSKSMAAGELSRMENGVGDRRITVVHNNQSRLANDGTYLGPVIGSAAAAAARRAESSKRRAGGLNTPENTPENTLETTPENAPEIALSETHEARRPEITFATTVKRSDGVDDDITKLPPRVSDEEHIAILQRQRDITNDDEVLYIPGPRDAERGVLPSRVVRNESDDDDDDDDDDVSPTATGSRTRQSDASDSIRMAESSSGTADGKASPDITDEKADDKDKDDSDRGRARGAQGITIQEPEKPSRVAHLEDDVEAFAHVVTSLRPRLHNMYERRAHARGQGSVDEPTTPSRAAPTRPHRRPTLTNLRMAFSRDKEEATPAPYLSWEPTLGRNSAFLGLSEEQREELGGIEYRSLKTLALVLLGYYWGFWLLGVCCLLPWILKTDSYGQIVKDASQSRVWWGFWTPHSAFMDLGFTLTPDSMNSFNTAIFPLLLMSFLIVIGNTGFPVMLRFVIWVLSKVVPYGSGVYEELKFLLDHPRRCFTLLFPSGATWWLFWLLVILNGIDLLFFIILDLGNGPIFALPAGIRILDGLFQAFSTRTAGFSCVNLAEVHPAVQASYMIMMYISVFPIAISVRRTNVYEEKSLGVYSHGSEIEEPANGTDLEYVGAHLRRQLSFDLWFLSVGFFILTISEGGSLQKHSFTMFDVLFEVVSAYGTVGMSLGYPDGNESLCSQFSVIGKLVIIAMMIRGRHRGLPYGLDRAILLPSESLNAKEAAAAEAELARGVAFGAAATRRESIASAAAGGPALARAPSMARSHRRSRSRSMDRARTSVLTQFLHPGPPKNTAALNVPAPMSIRRTMSDAVVSEQNTAHASGVDFAENMWRPRSQQQRS